MSVHSLLYYFIIIYFHVGHESEDQIPCLKEQAVKTQSTELDERHHSSLLEKLTMHSINWREIGSQLGFLPYELDNIHARPLLLSNAPNSWLNTMLVEWLQWAPGDSHK